MPFASSIWTSYTPCQWTKVHNLLSSLTTRGSVASTPCRSRTSWPMLAGVSSCVYETGADVVLCEWQHVANVTIVVTDWGTGGGRELNTETQSVVCPGWRRWGSEAPEHPVLKVWAANTASRLRGIIPGAFCLFRLMTLSSVGKHHTHAHTRTQSWMEASVCLFPGRLITRPSALAKDKDCLHSNIWSPPFTGCNGGDTNNLRNNRF